jgi:transcriptional regulator with XRE-family HTH domain
MTGSDVRAIRTKLELTVPQFADILGCAVSSLYRWEAITDLPVAIEVAQLRLLSLMQQEIDRDRSGAFAKSMTEAVVRGGGLLALYHLLHSVYGDL